MGILTHDELHAMVASGFVRGVPLAHIGAASIDLTLGAMLWVESPPRGGSTIVDLMGDDTPSLEPVDLLKRGHYDLQPGQFCLASSVEMFHLPNDLAGQVSLRSSLARSGLTHNMAGFVDPGFCGSVITLELVNVLRYRALRLRPGLKIAQVAFFRGAPVPKHASYATRGRYNYDGSATPSKGLDMPLGARRTAVAPFPASGGASAHV
ncbi:MAG: dCTP deaminase [Chromatiaceae bacterium]|nr:dCTP deaminase [Chromatiaceae bacterium]